MAAILFKWFLLAGLFNIAPDIHPYYVSVTEINHNKQAKSIEISSKIFTDDFEHTLRAAYKVKVDLLDEGYREKMQGIVKGYILKHLAVEINGKPVVLNFLGFEQDEEGIISYFEANDIPEVRSLVVKNSLLYEYKDEQISLLHITVDGRRRSHKMHNPDDTARFDY